MTDLQIKMDDDAMKAVVSRAILDQLDSAKRDQILEQAVTTLLTARKDPTGWSAKETTPLQQAFDQAVRSVAMDAVTETLNANPQFKERIRSLVADALAAVMDESDQSDLREKLGAAIGTSVTWWLHEQKGNRY